MKKKGNILVTALCITLLLCGCGSRDVGTNDSKADNMPPRQTQESSPPKIEESVIDITEQTM